MPVPVRARPEVHY